jgi:hypothetical protein
MPRFVRGKLLTLNQNSEEILNFLQNDEPFEACAGGQPVGGRPLPPVPQALGGAMPPGPRAIGWRPDSATVVVAASSNALSLLYQLVDAAMPTDMLRWALQNVHEGTSTRDIPMAINTLETERGYTRAVEEVPLFRDGPQCWVESSSNWAEYEEETKRLALYEVCTSRITESLSLHLLL